LLDRYSEIPILFIDDIGSESNKDRIREQYCHIIDERVGNKMPTIYSSNFSIEQIAETLGDRIASRLYVSYQIQFPPGDKRKRLELPSI
jgi:DNA replication protein DnaC